MCDLHVVVACGVHPAIHVFAAFTVYGSGLDPGTKQSRVVQVPQKTQGKADAGKHGHDRTGRGGPARKGGRAARSGGAGVALIMAARLAFAHMAHGMCGHIGDGRALHDPAGKMRAVIVISGDAWAEACSVMGADQAAPAVAIITDKYCGSEIASPGGEIASPGANLRAVSGRTQKGTQKGTLDLARNLHGRLASREQKQAEAGAGSLARKGIAAERHRA
jgi:Replication protein C C-terminal region